MAKKLILGIKLVRSKKIPEAIAKGEADSEQCREVRFDAVVTKGSFADPLFYSSPRLRKLIESFPQLEGKNVGYIGYSGFSRAKDGKIFVQQAIYPFENLKGKVFDAFEGKFIASELEKKALVELRNLFGKVILVPRQSIVTGRRISQLRKRHISAVMLGKLEKFVNEDGRKQYCIPESESWTRYSAPIDTMIAGINFAKRAGRKMRRQPRHRK